VLLTGKQLPRFGKIIVPQSEVFFDCVNLKKRPVR